MIFSTPATCTFQAFSTAMAEIKNYLWDFRRDGDSEEVHGHIHTSHHENEQAVARVAVGAQALLEEVKERMSLKLANTQ